MYELDFYEALDAAMNGKWVVGSDFEKGVIMTSGRSGYGRNINVGAVLSAYSFKSDTSWQIQVTKNLMNQKFKIIETQPEAFN